MEGVYSMHKVYSKFEVPKKFSTPAGTGLLNLYQEEIKDGVKSLTKTGIENVYESIQLDLESTKIENILHSAMMGDLSALKAREGSYCDATTMPKSLMEAQNLVLRMKTEFEKMPLEVKEKFNNSADKYIELMGTNEFNEIMSPYNDKVAKIAEEKNHKEYEKKVREGAQLNYDIARAQKALEGGSNE